MKETYWIFALGFFAQGLFGLRILVQWYVTEKKKEMASPLIYWHLSIVASLLMILYGIIRADYVIVFGQGLSYFIYIRNSHISGTWTRLPVVLRVFFILLPLSSILWMGQNVQLNEISFAGYYDLAGMTGQLLLNARFIYQLYYAEKRKVSVLPFGFWAITVIGSILIILYAVNRPEPVLLFAQSLGLIAAIRNVQIGSKKVYA